MGLGMFRKLQIEFVALVMGVVTIILLSVFACIGAMAYQQTADRLEADMAAAIDAAADDGRTPRGFAPFELGRHPEDRSPMPVAVYVLEGETLSSASRTGALLDEDVLGDAGAAAEAAPIGEVTPFSSGTVLLKRDVRGVSYVAFADDSAGGSVRGLIPIFAIVGAGALIVFFVVSILFARWVLRPVRRAWDQQRMFISNASHELKTPLAIIKANTEILLDEPETDAQTRAKWLSSTQGSVYEMEGLVDDMLALASIDEALDRRSGSDGDAIADASRIVEGIALQFESRAFEGGFSLEADVEDGIAVRGSADAVAQLVRILLDNACKYVDADGVVRVQLARRADGAWFSVSNTGEPIPPAKLDHIFERFYRGDEAHGSGSGHGLGLAIAKGLSDQMKAGLTVTSTPDATTFSFSLPLDRRASPTDASG